jgi:hypothetical protein
MKTEEKRETREKGGGEERGGKWRTEEVRTKDEG